jgi:hypothetical protein
LNPREGNHFCVVYTVYLHQARINETCEMQNALPGLAVPYAPRNPNGRCK